MGVKRDLQEMVDRVNLVRARRADQPEPGSLPADLQVGDRIEVTASVRFSDEHWALLEALSHCMLHYDAATPARPAPEGKDRTEAVLDVLRAHAPAVIAALGGERLSIAPHPYPPMTPAFAFPHARCPKRNARVR